MTARTPTEQEIGAAALVLWRLRAARKTGRDYSEFTPTFDILDHYIGRDTEAALIAAYVLIPAPDLGEVRAEAISAAKAEAFEEAAKIVSDLFDGQPDICGDAELDAASDGFASACGKLETAFARRAAAERASATASQTTEQPGASRKAYEADGEVQAESGGRTGGANPSTGASAQPGASPEVPGSPNHAGDATAMIPPADQAQADAREVRRIWPWDRMRALLQKHGEGETHDPEGDAPDVVTITAALRSMAEFATSNPPAQNVLRELEWSAYNFMTEGDDCPVCHQDIDKGHAPDCRLAASLRDPAPDGRELERQVEATIARCDQADAALAENHRLLDAAEAAVVKLREALEPFAELEDLLDETHQAAAPDIRRARQALDETSGGA